MMKIKGWKIPLMMYLVFGVIYTVMSFYFKDVGVEALLNIITWPIDLFWQVLR